MKNEMEVQYTNEILNSMTIADLKQICSDININVNSNISKRDLINLILSNQHMTIQESLRRTRNRGLKRYISSRIKTFMSRWCDSNTNISHPKFKDEKEEDIEKQCVICFENRKIFAGRCGHFVLCGECSTNICNQQESLCPICRRTWEDVRQIFI